jgi:uncharacterized protein with GYD domain
MPKYLVTASYTAEGAKGLLKDGGTKRRQAIESALKAVGGRVEAFYFALGKHDVYTIVDAPDNVAVAAMTLAVSAAGGAVSHTTVLLTPEELDQATKKRPNYTPPGQ